MRALRGHGPSHQPSRLLAVALGAALVAGSLAAGGAATAAPSPSIPITSFEPGRYIVQLADEAASTYEGGTQQLQRTAPEGGAQLDAESAEVEAYSAHLEQAQGDAAAEVGAEVIYNYTLAFNGFAADLSAEQAAELAARKDVVAVVPNELKQIQATPEYGTEFLGLDGEGGVWEQLGGAESVGEGVVVGILDTGVAPENPSFAGEPLGTAAGAEPYLDGDAITFAKGDGQTFTGVCETGPGFGADDCSTKIVGARSYVDGFGADRIGGEDVGEYESPRDGDGHGSHTGGTAVGNHQVTPTVLGREFPAISGVAPAAKIAAYKVCWSGPDPVGTADDGCATADLLAAINQAVADGVDVINYSIGGGAADTTVSPTDQAFLGAAAAGVFVAASAGNSGPGASTLDNASPWITTVAASTIPNYEATATLGDGQAFAGASISVAESAPVEAPLVLATDAVANGQTAEDAEICAPDSLDAAAVEGSIVVCLRGVTDRVSKSAEVAAKGGVGVLLVNPTPSSLDNDAHSVPTVHVDADALEAITAYAATEGATVTLAAGNSTGVEFATPQVAGFSSRGPVEADGSDILKPDVIAPGVGILAPTNNPEDGDPTWAFLSGTSMSSPHVAGLAALYLGERPNATPAEVKSALMTTAYDTVGSDGAAVNDPFAQGAGHADPTRFFEPGLLYLNGTDDWYSYIQGIGYDVGAEPIDASDLNLASIAIGELTGAETVTRTVTSTQAGTFEASVDIPGVDAVVEPSTLSFGSAGETAEFTVTFANAGAPLDEFATGSLTWTSGETTVRSPLAIRPVTLVAPDEVTGEGVDGSVDVEITPGGDGDIALTTTGLARGDLQPDATDPASEHSGAGLPGDESTWEVAVPEGAEFARFDLASTEQAADLDLVVYLLDGPGGAPVAGWQSATASADERVDLPAPEAGTYRVTASVFSVVTAGQPVAFDVTTTSIVPGAGAAELALDPSVLSGSTGVPTGYTASWAGLDPESDYLGLVRYGETGVSTAVTVETGEAVEPEPVAPVAIEPPTVTGTPKVGERLTAAPGAWDVEGLTFAYQWLADGEPIPGATGERFRLTDAQQGSAVSVRVTASAEGLPDGSADSEAVTVLHTSTLKVSVQPQLVLGNRAVTVTVRADSSAEAAPTGTATVRLGGSSYDVELVDGVGSVRIDKPARGLHIVTASYAGDEVTAAAKDARSWVLVIRF